MKEHELFIAIANAGRDYMEACSDIEAYLPPDESESWINAEKLLQYRDESEEMLEKLIAKIKADAIREAVDTNSQEFNMGYICFSSSLLEYADRLESK